MIPDRNLELQERMKNINDEYVVSIRFFPCLLLKIQHILWLIAYAEVKYNNNSTEEGKRTNEVYHCQVLTLYMKCYSINSWQTEGCKSYHLKKQPMKEMKSNFKNKLINLKDGRKGGK